MLIIGKQLELYKDCFNIYNLITKIDRNYRLCFDRINKHYCVINIAKNNQICLKTDYISSNILKTLQMTRVEKSKSLFEFIDNFNLSLEEKNKETTALKVCDSVKNLVKYSNRTNSISKNDIKKIIRGNYA